MINFCRIFQLNQRDRQDTSNVSLPSQNGNQMLRDPGIYGGDEQDCFYRPLTPNRSQEIDSTLIPQTAKQQSRNSKITISLAIQKPM